MRDAALQGVMGLETEMARWMHCLWLEDEGQDLVEYAVILTVIAVACLAFVYSGAASVRGIWTQREKDLVSANTTALGT